MPTPYDMRGLSNVYEKSNMLRQCIAAIVTNVSSFGWKIVPYVKDGAMDEGETEELQSFIDYANVEESLVTVNDKVTEDFEKYGFSFLEVVRDKADRVSFLRHAPSFKTRLLKKDTRAITVKNTIFRGKRRAEVVEKRKFRRFVQIVNGKSTYFKEFGDPRQLNFRTGEFGTVAMQARATELIHLKQNSEEPYGVPRWISQLPSILGSREAEEVNLRYFEDNTVPPMILTVAGGRLTSQSWTDLNKLLTEQGVGKDRQNKILLIEAVPEKEGLDDKGTVSLQVERLTDQRPSDGLFKEYDDANQAKVRSAFRLPPVVVGLSQDITFATANVSTFVAETQVFSAMRRRIEEVYNKKLVNHPQGLNLKTVKLEAKAQAITNPEQVIKALTALNVMGGVTPRAAIDIANESLQVSLPQYPEEGKEGWEAWMDAPIAMTLKELGGAATNTDNEQSVKDKSTKTLEKDGDTGAKAPEHGQE
jgi:PBSX family phage portal protein